MKEREKKLRKRERDRSRDSVVGIFKEEDTFSELGSDWQENKENI